MTKTAGGIMLPETAQTKLNIGEVVAHGEGYVDEVSRSQLSLYERANFKCNGK